MTTSDIPSNESLQHLGVEYQFRVTILEASHIPVEYEDIFCQFNFLHQHQEAYSTEPIKNPGRMDLSLNFSHMQNVEHSLENSLINSSFSFIFQFSVIVTRSFLDYLRSKPILFEVMGHFQQHLTPTLNK